MIVREAGSHAGGILGLFPELSGIGGMQEAGRLVAAALQEIAEEHNLFVELFSLNDTAGSHSMRIAGRTVPFRGFERAKSRFVLANMSRTLKFGKNHARIVLAAHPNLAVPAAYSRLGRPGLKTIVMTHGIEVWSALPLYRRRALRRATCVLAPSRFTVEKLIVVQGVSAHKIRRVPWPLNPDLLRMAAAPAGLPLPPEYPKGRQVILTVGRWSASERYKGVEELLYAVARLRSEYSGLHLVAIGSGDDLPRLRQLSAELGITDSVLFLESLTREQVASCYAHADIFALPSTGEGFGLVFLEAMAFAKPIVGVAVGGTLDIIEDGRNGFLVRPDDAGSLAGALGRLLRDEKLSAELGRHGMEIAQHKYRFETFRKELECVLADCDP
ncbi:MAG: glycosyltransferase family 4 protein [Acidobacteriota bacterium]|nr:glycosyltransferase family 4 protein [Acidobacteriota bacterium]